MLCRNQSLKNAKCFWSELVLKKILDTTAKFGFIFFLFFFQKPSQAFWSNESRIKNICAKYAAEQISMKKVIKILKLKKANWETITKYCGAYDVNLPNDHPDYKKPEIDVNIYQRIYK